MQIKGRPQGSELTVALRGELDHHCAEMVRQQLDTLIMDPRVKILTLDLKALTFMDSSGIGVIIGRYKRMQARGGRVQVCNVKPQIDRIMQLAGLYRIIGKCEGSSAKTKGRIQNAKR